MVDVIPGSGPADARDGSEERPIIAGAPAADDVASTVDADQRSLLRLFMVLLLGVGATYVMARMLWPLLPAIAVSAVVAVLVYPLYLPFRQAIGSRPVSAGLATVAVFFLLVLPAAALSVLVGHEIVTGIDVMRERAAGLLHTQGVLAQRFQRIAAEIGLDPANAWGTLGEQLQRVAGVLANRTLGFLSGLAGWLLQTGAALFTLYYLLRDGDNLVDRIERTIPLDARQSALLVERAREVMFATVYGNVAVALAQGALGGLAFAVLGLPGAALWGAVIALLSLLPVVGATIVWLPAGLLLLFDGEIGRGIALLAFGSLVISTVDNLLRALIVGGRAQMHPLVVFFSVLGGIFLFGAAGVLVGPVVFVLALAVLDIARRALEPPPPAVTTSRDPAAVELTPEATSR